MNYSDVVKNLNSKNEFMKHNNIKLLNMKENYAEVGLEINSCSLNPYGIVHGGAYYTMADCAAGIAARTSGKKYVTLNNSFNFIKPVSEGNIKAVANVIHRGKTTCIVNVNVLNESDDLLCNGTFTMFCLSRD